MKKTLLTTTMIAAVAALGLNGQAWAHHPSEDTNPNFETVDDLVSDMHNEVIDDMLVAPPPPRHPLRLPRR
ncbi:MAG: hypothetical protein P8Z31_03685 [Gammaproteobacteria bacterium]